MTLVALALLTLAAPAAPVVADSACPVLLPNDVPVQGRQSPLDSLTFTVAKQTVKLCYGRPSAKGRTMLGGEAVPFGKLWRTGANEPTVIFTPVALTIAGVTVAPGKYSIYTVPGAKQWEVIVNKSTSQWGHESTYTPEVKAQEVGRGKVTAGAAQRAGRDLHHRGRPGDGRDPATGAHLGEDQGGHPGKGRQLS